jgi:hypothetical protein
MKTKHKMKKGNEKMLQKVEYLKKTERKVVGNWVETWVIQQVEVFSFHIVRNGMSCCHKCYAYVIRRELALMEMVTDNLKVLNG